MTIEYDPSLPAAELLAFLRGLIGHLRDTDSDHYARMPPTVRAWAEAGYPGVPGEGVSDPLDTVRAELRADDEERRALGEYLRARRQAALDADTPTEAQRRTLGDWLMDLQEEARAVRVALGKAT